MDDAARAIVLAAEHYNGSEPVNVGTGHEITIQTLAELIADAGGGPAELYGMPQSQMDKRDGALR